MSILTSFFGWLRDLFNMYPHKELIRNFKNEPTVEIEIHESEKLRRSKKRRVSGVVAKSLANALDDAKIGYKIKYAFHRSYSPPTESPYDKDFATIQWWGNKLNKNESDALVLLTASAGGVTGGRHCVVGAQGLHQSSAPVRAGSGPTSRVLHAALHEVGHALGVPGDDDVTTPETETHGESWIEGNEWHRTLMMSTNKAEKNVCGKEIDPNPNGLKTIFHQRYCDCAIQRIKGENS